MKSKLIMDLSVYMIAPIILCSVVETKDLGFIITGVVALVAIYSLYCKNKESRINFSGLVFTGLYIILAIFKKEVESNYQIYIYDTYFLLILGITILICAVIEKDIIRRIYIDIQRSKGFNNLLIWSNIKKSGISKECKQLAYIVSGHLIVLSLVKVYSISQYGKSLYTSTQDREIIVSIIFLLAQMYFISKIMQKSKEVKNTKRNKNQCKSKYNLNNSRVVSLEEYKNVNK